MFRTNTTEPRAYVYNYLNNWLLVNISGEFIRQFKHYTLIIHVASLSPCKPVVGRCWSCVCVCVRGNHWCKPVYCKYETYRHLFLQILYSRSFSAIYSKARWAPNWCLFLFFFQCESLADFLLKKRYLNIYMSTTPYLTFLFGILTEDQTCSAHFAPASSPRRFFPKPGNVCLQFCAPNASSTHSRSR